MLKIYKCESGWAGYVLTRFFFVATICPPDGRLPSEQTMFVVEHRKAFSGDKFATVPSTNAPRAIGHFDELCNKFPKMWTIVA